MTLMLNLPYFVVAMPNPCAWNAIALQFLPPPSTRYDSSTRSALRRCVHAFYSPAGRLSRTIQARVARRTDVTHVGYSNRAATAAKNMSMNFIM